MKTRIGSIFLLCCLAGCAIKLNNPAGPAPVVQTNPVTPAVQALPHLNLQRDAQPHPELPMDTGDKAPIPASVSLRGHLISYLAQGQEGDCVAESWATCSRVLRNMEGKPDFQPSRNYVYFFAREWLGYNTNADTGSTVLSGAWVMSHSGAPPESMWPYTPDNMFLYPPVKVRVQAHLHMLQGIRMVYGDAGGPTLSIRQAIAAQRPVVMGIPVFASWYTWQGPPGGVIDVPADPNEVPLGYHCVTVLGYDANEFVADVNWGTQYGDSGFAHFTEAFIAKYGFSAFTATRAIGP